MNVQKKEAEKKKRDLIIVSALLVTFAFTFTKFVLLRKSASAPKAPATVQADESRWMTDHLVYTTNLRSHDAMRATQENVWAKEWGRDPFTPIATFSTITKAVNMTLSGILWDEVNPKAIVNGKTLYNGDAIYGYTVDKIKHKSVVLKTGEKTIELSVFSPVEDVAG